MTMQSSLLGWGTLQSCLCWCSNADLGVGMGNGRAGERFGLVFFDIRMQNPLSGWGKVQSCLFRYNITEFSIEMRKHGMLQFMYVCVRTRWFSVHVQYYFFRSNNTEFSVRKRMLFLVFVDVPRQSSLLGWGMLESWFLLIWGNGSALLLSR